MSLLSERGKGSEGEGAPQELAPGDEGDGVRTLQEQLNAAGYKVEVTGTYDEATTGAVKAFQRDAGLAETGIADAETMAALSQPQAQDPREVFYGGAQ